MAEHRYDVVIAGASFGGVAAALAAAADPAVRVVLLEAGSWVGGQATSQGVTRWDEAEAALTESTGSSKSYRDVRTAIRARYDGKRSALGKKQQFFNPGFAEVGPPFVDPEGKAVKGHPFAAAPQVTREVMTAMMHAAGNRLDIVFGATVTAADVHDGAVHGLTVESESGTDTYIGSVYLDATDLGNLLPLAGVAWVIGAESKADTGEQNAENDAHPEWIQPITVPIALELRPAGEDHRIPKPDGYDEIVQNQSFTVPEGDITKVFDGWRDGDTLWNYRQFIDPKNFGDGRLARTTMNVGSNDYKARAIPTDDPDVDAEIVDEARNVSIAYLYWLQNDAPRDDGSGNGYPNLMACPDVFGTDDGTATEPYIRESRRLADPHVRVVQRDIDSSVNGVRARRFPDTCGIGWYTADVHAADTGTPNIGTRYQSVGTAPFQVPLGSLLPKELNNFVAACKNIGATHITSGAYRVHPVEWAIGEAAGVLAAYCTTQKVTPHDVSADANRVTAFQRRLLARGAPICWWSDVSFEHDARAYAAIHLLGARGTFEGDETLAFHPDADLGKAGRDAIDARVHPLPWPSHPMTRAQSAVFICEQLGLPL